MTTVKITYEAALQVCVALGLLDLQTQLREFLGCPVHLAVMVLMMMMIIMVMMVMLLGCPVHLVVMVLMMMMIMMVMMVMLLGCPVHLSQDSSSLSF